MDNTSETSSVPVFEIDQPEAYGQYMLGNRREILFHLQALQGQQRFVTLYADEGNEFFLSSILAVDDENNRLFLDLPGHPAQQKRALAAQQITLSAVVDRIRMQCRLGILQAAEYANKPALQTALPDRLLRLQRREFFRVETPLLSPLRCKFAQRHADGTAEAFDFPLHDISGGGVCLIGSAEQAGKFSLGEIFADCRLEIPGESVLSVNLRVREISRVESIAGDHQLRLGCEFVNLPGTRLTLIERYITRRERMHKIRPSDNA